MNGLIEQMTEIIEQLQVCIWMIFIQLWVFSSLLLFYKRFLYSILPLTYYFIKLLNKGEYWWYIPFDVSCFRSRAIWTTVESVYFIGTNLFHLIIVLKLLIVILLDFISFLSFLHSFVYLCCRYTLMGRMYMLPSTLQSSFLSTIAQRAKQSCLCFSSVTSGPLLEIVEGIPTTQYCNAVVKLVAEMEAIMTNFNKIQTWHSNYVANGYVVR